jgi:diguanylate cyclase (GGDEF)-like protein
VAEAQGVSEVHDRLPALTGTLRLIHGTKLLVAGGSKWRPVLTVDGLSVGVGLVCLVPALLLTPVDTVRWQEVAAAVALQLTVGLGLVWSHHLRDTESRIAGVMSVVAYLFSVALLRDAAGAQAGFGPLVLLPVLWAALRGRRLELAVAVTGVAAVYLLPQILVGPPRYPTGNWRAGLLFTMIAATLGVLVLQLVERVRALVGELTELAHTDALTGLLNRRAWCSILEREVRRAELTGLALTVAVLDLDGFKAYNDTHGHLAADRLLKSASAAWQSQLRGTDVLARWGGDEFTLLLAGCDETSAAAVLERMQEACPEAAFCAGISQAAAGDAPESLLEAADDALYATKRARPSNRAMAGL